MFESLLEKMEENKLLHIWKQSHCYGETEKQLFK